MAGTYIEAFGGYIADVARMWFKRCGDNRVFYFDELTNVSVAPQINTTEINAGWSLFPVAVLPGQSTLEISATSGKFESELFAMTNGTNFSDENEAGEKFATVGYQVPVTEKAVVKGSAGSWYVIVENEPVAGTIYIQGFEATDLTIDTTDLKKILIDAAATPGFAADDEIRVTYNYLVKNDVRETRIDNRSSAQGEAYLKFPVYSDGSDCSENGIVGYVLMHVYNARVTQQPGLNGQYKSASTFDFSLSALDAHRNDEKIYSIAYYKV